MNGQGVDMAVHYGAILQVLLSNVHDFNDLSARLHTFENLRLPRTAIIQNLSNIPQGMEQLAAPKIESYLRGRDPILSIDGRNARTPG
jgi:2-polyprenyl-6-methoxyphenol hydroxylase-like FAD-dependent oxidoreductase